MKEFLHDLLSSHYVLAFTGAGMDTESNLPDFRGPEGLWRNHDPRTLASVDALHSNYPLFHEFYSHRIHALDGVEPHEGHYFLSQLEQAGLLKGIITQNISGLHERAGSKRVIELHGSMAHFHCNSCQQQAFKEDFLAQKSCSCGGPLRPSLTLFGEALPQVAFQEAITELEKADFLLILGSSLEVYPAAQLPFMFPMTRCFVNLEPVSQQSMMSYVYEMKIGEFLKKVKEAIYETNY